MTIPTTCVSFSSVVYIIIGYRLSPIAAYIKYMAAAFYAYMCHCVYPPLVSFHSS